MLCARLLVLDAHLRTTLGTLPLPNTSAFTRIFNALWGEGWSEGVTDHRSSGNPLTPALSPNGERECHRGCFTIVLRSRRSVR